MRHLSSLVLISALAACQPGPAPTADVGATAATQAREVLVPPALAASALDGTDRIADVAELAVQSVVHIEVAKTIDMGQVPEPFRRMFGEMPPQVQRGNGSGVLVDASGLVLTNAHVVAGADELMVKLNDGRTFEAKVAKTDPATDIALIELVGDVPTDLPAARFGDSDALRLGQVVLAVGSPLGFAGSVSLGIVSARGRAQLQGLSAYQDYLQTDAAINQGNSGGALVNLDGELVGIPSAIASMSGGYDGIGLAIPSNLAYDVMQQLLENGKVSRGYLGVSYADVNGTVAEQLGLSKPEGAIVGTVQPDSAAEAAGLQMYDVVIGIDGDAIESGDDLRNTIGLKAPGTKIQIDVIRDGKPRTLVATLGTRPGEEDAAGTDAPEEPEVTAPKLLEGIEVADGTPQADGGVLVEAVTDGSLAARAGLQPGDVIVEANRTKVTSVKGLYEAVAEADGAMLLVKRGPTARLVMLGQ